MGRFDVGRGSMASLGCVNNDRLRFRLVPSINNERRELRNCWGGFVFSKKAAWKTRSNTSRSFLLHPRLRFRRKINKWNEKASVRRSLGEEKCEMNLDHTKSIVWNCNAVVQSKFAKLRCCPAINFEEFSLDNIESEWRVNQKACEQVAVIFFLTYLKKNEKGLWKLLTN